MREAHNRQERPAVRPCCAPRKLNPYAGALLLLFLFLATAQASDLLEDLHAAKLFETASLAKVSREDPKPAEVQKLERVSSVYRALVAHYPDDARSHAARAAWLWSLGEKQDAFIEWTASEKLDPNSASAANALGECSLAQGEAKAASDWFARSAALEPANAAYHFDLANVRFMFRHQLDDPLRPGENLKLALAEFKRASALDPFNINYAQAYAETFYALEDPDWQEASRAWKHYREMTNSDDFACVNLARVYIKLGQPDEARRFLEKVRLKTFAPVKAHLLKEINGTMH